MFVRSTLLAAALAALFATPAAAQNPNPPYLDGIKPCYVAAQENQREFVAISGHNFTPFKKVKLYIDDIETQGVGAEPQADAHGVLIGSVQAPFIEEGERPFTLRVVEIENFNNFATAAAKVTSLSVAQTPSAANTSDRVRFRGRGFTDLARPVYMHYVFAGKSKKTIRLGPPTGDCGLFSVKRRQFPFKRSPQRGVWTIQFDQTPKYDPKASPRVPLTVKVSRKIKPTRAPAR